MLKEFVERLSRLEDKYNLFEPEYLSMDTDEVEASRVCEGCDRCYTPEDYCERVISRLEDKEVLLSAGNRILDALAKTGYWVTSWCIGSHVETVRPKCGEVELDWGGDYGESFCRRCRLYGKEECPEDVRDETCARHRAALAAEQVVSAVNELL